MKPVQLFVLLTLCLGAAIPAGAAGTNSIAAVRPRSVFVDDPTQGRDPFFPQSTRRMVTPALPGTNAPAPMLVSGDLFLKGISGSQLQPLILINNATIGLGESGDVRVGGRTLKVRCKEIHDRSAIIEIDGTGEVRELKLREGI